MVSSVADHVRTGCRLAQLLVQPADPFVIVFMISRDVEHRHARELLPCPHHASRVPVDIASKHDNVGCNVGQREVSKFAMKVATYASVLRVLGLQGDLDLVARDDVLGRKLQDLKLPTRKVAPRRASGSEKTSSGDSSDPVPPPSSST